MFNPCEMLSEEDIEVLRERREKDRAHNENLMIAQRGGQQRMLSSKADITIGGGSRGGSKSFSLLMKAGEYLYEPHFRGIIFRKGLSDLDDLADKSMQLFPDFGTFRVSKDNMGWSFDYGGSLRFSYHDGDFQTFDDRFRGKEF